MAIINGTYTDETVTKSYLVRELYNADFFSANIVIQAKNAKKWVNTYIGKEVDFTIAELAEIKNEGIILAASQRTACLMELKRQERSDKISEETKIDCDAAEATLIAWCHNNGIIPAKEKKAALTGIKIPFAYTEEEYVI